MNAMDLVKAFGYIDDDLLFDAANDGAAAPEPSPSRGRVRQPNRGKPPRGGVKAKVIAALAIVAMVAVVAAVIYAAGLSESDIIKQVPVYQGMEISAVETGQTTSSAASHRYGGDYYGNNDYVDKDNPFGNGSTAIEQEAQSTLSVVTDTENFYYADLNEDIYITIKFSNPDSYEILSFVINGDKYTSYMFEKGSDLENIIIKVNVGSNPGIVEYTISQIKYVDGTEIKDVIIEGDTVVSCGVRSADGSTVTSAITDEATTLTTISFTAKVVDPYSLIAYSNGYVKAVLYDGDSIIQTADLEVGTNEVEFTNLSPYTLYQYAIVAYYDDLSGIGTALNTLCTNALYTPAVVLFDGIEVGKEGITFGYNWYSDYEGANLTSLTLTGGGETRTLDASVTSITGLLSNTEYTLTASYIGVNGASESIYITFTTEEKAVPVVDVSLTSTQTEISYSLAITDTDSVGSLASVTLSKDGATVQTMTTSSGTFSGLLTGNSYTVTAVYTYDLGDGTGSHTATDAKTISTKTKSAPVIALSSLSSDYTEINYSLTITDTDSVGSLASVTLSKDGATVQTLTTSSGTFSGLLTGNTYTVTAVYTYDLGDGAGSHTKQATKSISTKSKSVPAVDIALTFFDESSLTFNVSYTDTDNVGSITSIVLYKGSDAVKTESTPKAGEYAYTNLDISTEYNFVVTYSYDLGDGTGSHTAQSSLSRCTGAKIIVSSLALVNIVETGVSNITYLEVTVDNPNELTLSSAIINGKSYTASETSTTTQLIVYIDESAQIYTITQITGELGGNTYTVDMSYSGAAYTTYECTYSEGVYTLAGYSGSEDVVLPDTINGSTYVLKSKLFYNNTGIKSVVISDGVKGTGGSVFQNCTALESVTIGSGLWYIQENDFSGCTSLKTVTLKKGVNIIGESAFANCTALESVSLPESITGIYIYAFENCSALTSIVIPDSVTAIHEYVFRGCTSLESVVIGSKTRQIMGGVFDGISSSAKIYYKGTETEWNNIVFGNGVTDWYSCIFVSTTTATVYYYSENAPTESGNYWHYVNGVPAAW